MGRAKRQMELITDKKARLVAFSKRKEGMLKKATELKILCDVELCMIIYGPRIEDCPVKAEIWPENCDSSINSLINSYKNQKPEHKRRNAVVDLSNFFQDRNQKIEDELAKLRKKNNKAMYETWDDQYDSFTKENLMKFEHMLEYKMQQVRSRIDSIKNTQKLYNPSAQCFYGSHTVDMQQTAPWSNYNIPFPYGVGSNTTMPVGGYPMNQICYGQPTTASNVMKLENGNLVSNTPLPMINMQHQAMALPNLLYHLQMANASSSHAHAHAHAHAIQMEDYYGSRDLQMKNFLRNF